MSLQFLKNSGLQIISYQRKQNKTYILLTTIYLQLIIVGSEENGISQEFLKMSDFQTKIPILGNINSLNVSVSIRYYII